MIMDEDDSVIIIDDFSPPSRSVSSADFDCITISSDEDEENDLMVTYSKIVKKGTEEKDGASSNVCRPKTPTFHASLSGNGSARGMKRKIKQKNDSRSKKTAVALTNPSSALNSLASGFQAENRFVRSVVAKGNKLTISLKRPGFEDEDGEENDIKIVKEGTSVTEEKGGTSSNASLPNIVPTTPTFQASLCNGSSRRMKRTRGIRPTKTPPNRIKKKLSASPAQTQQLKRKLKQRSPVRKKTAVALTKPSSALNSLASGFQAENSFKRSVVAKGNKLTITLKRAGLSAPNNDTANRLSSPNRDIEPLQNTGLGPLHLSHQITSQQNLGGNNSLRPIAIDGSNVAYAHGKNLVFNCLGIKLCINYFLKRGHTIVKAFVPQSRQIKSPKVMQQHLLEELLRQNNLVYTPSRVVGKKRVTCYDDRFIVEYAAQTGAVIVSNDHYRDLMHESQSFRETIEQRLLLFSFVEDVFLVPNDPLGRGGPDLETFLKMPS